MLRSNQPPSTSTPSQSTSSNPHLEQQHVGVTQTVYFPLPGPQRLPAPHPQSHQQVYPTQPQHYPPYQQNQFPQPQQPHLPPQLHPSQPLHYAQQPTTTHNFNPSKQMQEFYLPQIGHIVTTAEVGQNLMLLLKNMGNNLQHSNQDRDLLNKYVKELTENQHLQDQVNLQLIGENQSLHTALQQHRSNNVKLIQEKEGFALRLKTLSEEKKQLKNQNENLIRTISDHKIQIATLLTTQAVTVEQTEVSKKKDQTMIQNLEARLAAAQAEILKLQNQERSPVQRNELLSDSPKTTYPYQDEDSADSEQSKAVKTLTFLHTAQKQSKGIDEKDLLSMKDKFINFDVEKAMSLTQSTKNSNSGLPKPNK